MISGIVIAIVCIGLGVLGGPVLGIVLMVCSLIGYFELARALQVHDSGEEVDRKSGIASRKENQAENSRLGSSRSLTLEDLINDHSFRFNALEVIGWIGVVGYYIALIAMSVTSGAASAATLKNALFGTSDGTIENAFLQSANMATLTSIFAVFFLMMGIYVLTFPKYTARQVISAFFSYLYCPVMISFVFRAVFLPYGRFVYALIFLSSWICDTCAFATGMMFGKHKLAPVLSPKKSIEGAIGGVAGSALTCLLAAFLLGYLHPGEHLGTAFVIIGICGSVISQIGDLAASGIKRNFGIKDYGKIIPGHGGIMDRFDSVIFTAPMIYGLSVLFLVILRV